MDHTMITNDLKNPVRSREQIRQAMHDAFKANDNEAFTAAFDEMLQRVALDVREDFEQRVAGLEDLADERALAARGVKPLTREEKDFYKALEQSVNSKHPRQAIENGNLVMPDTTINRVFDELQTDHPLLRRLNFIPTGAAVKIIVNANGYQAAQWGERPALPAWTRAFTSSPRSCRFARPCSTSAPCGWIPSSARPFMRCSPTAWRRALSTAPARTSPSA